MEAQLRLLSAPRAPRPRPAEVAGPTTTSDTATDADPAPALEPGATTWRLSASTRAVGRRGIASAREALRRAQAATLDRDDRAHDGRQAAPPEPPATAHPHADRRSAA